MTTYSYDRENRLISQNVDGNVTSFAYDGFGRKRRESRGVNPDVILNWDGDQMIVESSDLDPEAPSKAYYVADGVIYAENANLGSRRSRRDYAVDFLGSVTGLTDSDARLTSVRRWSAYGKLLSGSSEPIGYFWTGNTGSRVYQSLGLNDNRARHYGRNIKQWITRDPLWPSELSYAYVSGNPVTRIDPSGKRTCPDYGEVPSNQFDCSQGVAAICAEAKKNGLSEGDIGGVICCGGKKYACFWGAEIQGFPITDPVTVGIIADCVTKHEQSHINDVTCKGNGIERPSGVNPGLNLLAEECKAYYLEIMCYKNSIAKCDGSADPGGCKTFIEAFYRDAIRNLVKFCLAAPTPSPRKTKR
jgi:RHS repeat-associated protein